MNEEYLSQQLRVVLYASKMQIVQALLDTDWQRVLTVKLSTEKPAITIA